MNTIDNDTYNRIHFAVMAIESGARTTRAFRERKCTIG